MMLKKSLMFVGSVGALSLFVVAGCSSNNPGGSDGGGGDSGVTDSGSGKDSGAKDSGQPPPMCPTPADVSGLMPTQPTPPKPAAKACQQADYAGYWTACRDAAATAKTCQDWGTAHDTCAKCLESAEADASWGPLVIGGGIIKINLAGCYSLVGESGCATAYSNLDQCRALGCGQQCPVTDNASFAQYQACVKTVSGAGCKKYADTLNTACNPDSGIAKCNVGSDFQTSFYAVGPIFCGP